MSPLLKQVAVILNPVVKAAPALIDALYVMAQVKYLSGEPVGPGGQVGPRVLPHTFIYSDTQWVFCPWVSVRGLPAWDTLHTRAHTHIHFTHSYL